MGTTAGNACFRPTCFFPFDERSSVCKAFSRSVTSNNFSTADRASPSNATCSLSSGSSTLLPRMITGTAFRDDRLSFTSLRRSCCSSVFTPWRASITTTTTSKVCQLELTKSLYLELVPASLIPGMSTTTRWVSGRILTNGSLRVMSKVFSFTMFLLRYFALSVVVSFNVALADSFLVTTSIESSSDDKSSSISFLTKVSSLEEKMRKELTTAVVRFIETSPYSSPNNALMTVVLPTET